MEALIVSWLDGPMTLAMIEGLPRTLVIVAVVATGVMAGVYFAFSTFVMAGLRLAPDEDGIRAMQGINEAAPASPPFVLTLFGTGVLGIGLGVWALTDLDRPAAPYVLAGGVLYLVTVILTGAYHIPRNNALLEVDPVSAEAGEAWRRFYDSWVPANHARALFAAAATGAYVLALLAT